MEYSTKTKGDILKIACEIKSVLYETKKEPIFVCVGSDNVVGDSFGALVGHILINKYNIPAMVVGNLDYNITNKNINIVIDFLKKEYPTKTIIIIDSALGSLENLNNVKINNCGCFVAGAFGKNNTLVGNASILAFVNLVGCNNLMFLKSCKLKNIMHTACAVAKAINLSFYLPKVI